MAEENSTALTGVEIISELKPGSLIDLQFRIPLNARVKLPLVGYDLGRYLIVKYPDPKRYGSYSDVIKPTHVAIGRFLVEGDTGECAAFETTILAVTKMPANLIFMAYPKKIETRQLRKQQRVQTHIPCEISTLHDDLTEENSSNRISGLINDLSLDGCKFLFKAAPGITGVKKRPVRVFFYIPGETEQASVTAFVRNSRLESGKIKVGLQFSDDRKDIFRLLDTLMIDME